MNEPDLFDAPPAEVEPAGERDLAAEVVRQLTRERYGLTTAQLAERLGVERSALKAPIQALLDASTVKRARWFFSVQGTEQRRVIWVLTHA